MTNTTNTANSVMKGRTGSRRARRFAAAVIASFAFAAIAPAASMAGNGVSLTAGGSNISGAQTLSPSPQTVFANSTTKPTLRIYVWTTDSTLSASARTTNFSINGGTAGKFKNAGNLTSESSGSCSYSTSGNQTFSVRVNTAGSFSSSRRGCYFDIEFSTGNAAGSYSENFSTSGQNTISGMSLNETISANAPAMQIWNSGNSAQETSHAYGDVIEGSSSSNYTFTVKNTGNVPLDNPSTQSISGTDSGQFSIVSTTCGVSLAVGATCNVVTKFSPTSAGAKTATLNVGPTFSGTSYAQTVTLSGTGLAQTYTATAQTSGGADLTSYSFADTIVGNNSSTYTFNVKNTGNTAATFAANGSSVALSGTNSADYTVTATTCTSSVAVNGTCTVTVRFNPSTSDPNAAAGARSATLTVTPSNTADGTNTIATADTVSLSGNAVAQTRYPVLYDQAGTTAITSQDYGQIGVGEASPKTFTLKNDGNFTLAGTGSANQSISGDQASEYTITGTTCGTSIAPGGSCTITVSFAPTADGARNASLDIATTDGNGTGGATVHLPLTGTGSTATYTPGLFESDGTTALTDHAFADTIGTLQSSVYTFKVVNSGTGILKGAENQSITGTDADQFTITSTTCVAAGVDPGTSCNVSVRFNPTTAGAKSAVLTVATTNGTPANVSVNLTGTSVQAVQTPSTLDGTNAISSYGFADTIATQVSATKTITLKNTGNVALSGIGASGQSLTGDNASDFSITATTCTTASLAVNATCTITVRFNPATQGAKTAHLVITPSDRTNVNSSVANVDLSGTALEATQTATLQNTAGSSNLTSYAFADTTANTQSAVYVFTLRNTGNVTLNGVGSAGQSLTGDNASEFTITATTCTSGSLAPNATCTISVRFNPATTSIDSLKSAHLVVTPTGRTNVTATGGDVALSGNVIGIKKIPTLLDTAGTTVTSSYTFADTVRTLSNSYTFVLKNTGNTLLSGTGSANQSISGTDSGNFSITSTTCGTTLAVNATCNVVVRFLPTTTGSKSANLVVNTTDGTSNNPATVALSGGVIQDTRVPTLLDTAGTTPTSAYTFPSTIRTQSNSYTFVLKNTGNTTMNGTGAANQSITGTDAAQYSITSSTCGTSLAVNATCNVVVRFLPTTTGSKSANLVVNTTDGTSGNPATIALTGGVIQDVPALTYYDTAGTTPLGATKDFGNISNGSNSAYTIVLKNTGNVPVTNPSTQSITGTDAARFVKTSTTCTTSLAVNATCNIVVTYTPTAITTNTATLNVTGTETSKSLALTATGGGIIVLNNGTQNTRSGIASRQWQDTVDIGARGSYGSTFRAGFDVAVEPGHTITDVLVSPSSQTNDNDPGTYQYVSGSVTVSQQPGGGGRAYVSVSQPITALTSWATGISDGLLSLCIGPTSTTTNRRIFFKLKDDQGKLTPALPANVGIDDASFACGGYPLIDAQKVVSVGGVNAASGTTEAVTTPGTSVVYSFVGHGKGGGFNGLNWRIRNAATGAMFVKNASGGWNSCAAPCTGGFVTGYSQLSQADNTTGQITVSFPARGRWVVEGIPTGTNADGNAVQFMGSALVNSEKGSTSASSPQITVSGAPSDHPNTNSSWTMTATLTDTSDPANTYDSIGGSGATIEWDLNGNTTDGPNADGFESRSATAYALTSAELSRTLDLTGKTPGPYTIRARVTDNGALSVADPSRASKIYTKTFTINTPPVATNQTVDVQADDSQPASITLAGTDANGDSLSFSIPNRSGSGTISDTSGTGAARSYSWPADFTGHDTYTFVADDAHNATGSGTLTVRVHPNTRIDAGTPTENQATKTTTAHFEFSSPQSPISSYECRVLNDGTVIRAWASCSTGSTGSTDYSNLPDGVNRFEVRAVNADGQSDGTPAAYSWRVDNTVPTVNVTGPRSNQSNVQPRPTNDTTPSYSFTVNDRSPQETVTYECKLHWGPEADIWHSCGGASSSSGSGVVDITGDGTPFGLTDPLSEGTYSLEIRATDEVGNVGPAKPETFKVDTTAPISSFSSGAEGLVNLREQRFGVNSNEAGSTFRCRLVGQRQGETFNGACPGGASPVFSSLADDVYVLYVSAIDPSTNEDPNPVAQHFEVDATEPTTHLTSTLPALTKSRRVDLTFTGADSRALKQFECRRDSTSDLDWASCQSPESFGGLAEGSHKIEIRAVDEAGNRDSTPESITWLVDNTSPTTTIDASPAADSKSTAPSVTFHASETATTRCQLDGGSWSVCTSPVDVKALAGGTLAQGAHRLRVLSTDPADNAETTGDAASWRTDTIAPSVNLVQKPTNPAAKGNAVFGFNVLDGSPAVASPDTTTSCSIDGADYAACSSPVTLTNPASGSHNVRIKATDAAGNDSDVVSYTWTVTASDVAPPTIDSSNPVTGAVARTGDAQFAFSHPNEGSVTLECRVDSNDWQNCTSPTSVRGLAEGEHTFQVRATDSSGNHSDAASSAWTVNSAPPGTMLDGAPAGRSRAKTGVFKFSSNVSGATFECQLDSGSWAACESPFETPELTDGRHNLKVRATIDGKVYDPSPVTRGWTIDTKAPNTTITEAPSGNVQGRDARISFTSDDRWATFQCKVDDGDFATCASPTQLSKLTEGPHTFTVRAVDPYGNRDDSAEQASWQTQIPTGGGTGPVKGSTTATLTGGYLILPALDQPIVLPAGSLSFSGDVSATGEWSVSKDGVQFPQLHQALSAGGLNVIANISISSVGGGNGALPKDGGTASMSFPAQLKITLQTESGVFLISESAGCFLRPIDFRLTGTYDPDTKVLALDQENVLFPKTSVGCGSLGSLFDSQLGLPRNDISLHTEFAVTQNATAGASIARALRGVTSVPVDCPKANACSGRLVVSTLDRRGRKTRAATANFDLPRARKANVPLKLSSSVQAALKKAGAKGLPVVVELWPTHSGKATSVKRVRLYDGSANRKGGKR